MSFNKRFKMTRHCLRVKSYTENILPYRITRIRYNFIIKFCQQQTQIASLLIDDLFSFVFICFRLVWYVELSSVCVSPQLHGQQMIGRHIERYVLRFEMYWFINFNRMIKVNTVH